MTVVQNEKWLKSEKCIQPHMRTSHNAIPLLVPDWNTAVADENARPTIIHTGHRNYLVVLKALETLENEKCGEVQDGDCIW